MATVVVVAAGVLIAAVLVFLAVRLERRRYTRHEAPTFLFADLVGYTTLTAEQGDEHATALARRFRDVMCELSREHGARQVKSMGDGVMIWVPDPVAAVALARRTVEDVGTRADLLPVHVGVHTGPALMRGCDWYGHSVNVAARLASSAAPNDALISDATRDAAREQLDRTLGDPRDLPVKGLQNPIHVWRLA